MSKNESTILIEKLQARQAELEKENEALRNKESFLNAIMNNVGDPVFVKNDRSQIILANDSFCQMYDMAKAEIIGKTLAEKVPKDEQEHFFKVDRQVLADGIKNTCEETLTVKGNTTKTIITTKTRYIDEHGNYFLIGVISDITERKLLENKLNQKANTDHLTGVNNRGQFIELATLELSRAIRYQNELSLLMMDIDLFKSINDTHGHIAGDAVLRKLTEICQHHLRENDILGRIGGEEFAAMLPQTSQEDAVKVAEHLRSLIADLSVFDEESGAIINFTVSIGVSSLKPDVNTLEAIFHQADIALYKAKKSGRNQVSI